MPVEIADTLAGIDELSKRFNTAMRDIVGDALHEIQLFGALFAPAGTPGNTTNPPGDLKRSIDVQGPQGGDGLYAGRVGPTVIYGRQRELGGHIYPKFARWLVFTKFGDTVYTKHVYQPPHPYMKPGRALALRFIARDRDERLTKVIEQA